jgi:hypothetical protein
VAHAGTTSTLWIGRLVLVALGLACALLVTWTVMFGALAEDRTALVCVVPGVALFVGIYAWNVYWVGTRIAVALSLDDGVLRWTAPFRSGSCALADLTKIDSRGWPAASLTIHHRGGDIRCQVMTRGLEAFLHAIAERRPDLPIDTSKVRTYWGAADALGLRGNAPDR